MKQYVYYKTFTIDGESHTVFTPEKVTKEEFENLLFYVRRLIGYTLWPRWCAIRLFLAEVLEFIRKKGLYKHKVKKMANALLKKYDAFENLHMYDFDTEFIDIMGNAMSGKVLGKVNEIRGSIGGVLLQHHVKNYILYSYPETLAVLCRNSVYHYEKVMKDINQKYKMDFSGVFKSLSGNNILMASYSLMSAVEDAIGERLPLNMDATGTGADEKLHTLEGMFLDEDNLREAIMEAYNEMPKEKQEATKYIAKAWGDHYADTLAQKYKVSELK